MASSSGSGVAGMAPWTLLSCAGVHGPGVGGERGVVADDGVDRLDVELDEVAGVLGEVAGLGDDQRHGLAGEAHVVLGEAAERPPAGAALEVDPRLVHVAVEVGAGEHGDDAGQLAGRGDVEGRDRSRSDVAAQERHVQHPGHHDVVDVRAVAGHQPGVLATLDPLADEAVARRRRGGPLLHRGHDGCPCRPAAVTLTASMIPW